MKNINEYNQNPHYCKQCNKPILCTDSSKLSQVKKKIFCNSSCAASYNNKILLEILKEIQKILNIWGRSV